MYVQEWGEEVVIGRGIVYFVLFIYCFELKVLRNLQSVFGVYYGSWYVVLFGLLFEVVVDKIKSFQIRDLILECKVLILKI